MVQFTHLGQTGGNFPFMRNVVQILETSTKRSVDDGVSGFRKAIQFKNTKQKN